MINRPNMEPTLALYLANKATDWRLAFRVIYCCTHVYYCTKIKGHLFSILHLGNKNSLFIQFVNRHSYSVRKFIPQTRLENPPCDIYIQKVHIYAKHLLLFLWLDVVLWMLDLTRLRLFLLDPHPDERLNLMTFKSDHLQLDQPHYLNVGNNYGLFTYFWSSLLLLINYHI